MPSDPQKYAFNLEFGRFDWEKVKVGRLRSAYLVGFALFGYRSAFGSRLRVVREQLENVEEDILLVFSITDVHSPRDELTVLHAKEPAWLQSVAVQMGSHIVFLPDPFAETTPYETMVQQSRAGMDMNAKIQADQLIWPTGPMHVLDG